VACLCPEPGGRGSPVCIASRRRLLNKLHNCLLISHVLQLAQTSPTLRPPLTLLLYPTLPPMLVIPSLIAVSEGTTHYHSPPLISVMPCSQLKFDTCHVLTDSRRPGYLQHNESRGAAGRLGKVISRDLEMPGQHDMCAHCADC